MKTLTTILTLLTASFLHGNLEVSITEQKSAGNKKLLVNFQINVVETAGL